MREELTALNFDIRKFGLPIISPSAPSAVLPYGRHPRSGCYRRRRDESEVARLCCRQLPCSSRNRSGRSVQGIGSDFRSLPPRSQVGLGNVSTNPPPDQAFGHTVDTLEQQFA